MIAVLAVLRFYLALKTHLATHKPLAKLLAFKIIVFFAFLINVRETTKIAPALTYTRSSSGL